MDGKGEYLGSWWLPGTDRKVSGILNIDPNLPFKLLLDGSLRPEHEFAVQSQSGGVTRLSFTQDSLAAGGNYPVVHGQVEREIYTLFDARRTSFRGDPFGRSQREEVQFQTALRGAFFAENEIPAGNSAYAKLRHLTGWIGESGIEHTLNFDDEKLISQVLRVAPLERREIEVSEYLLVLSHALWITDGQPYPEKQIRQNFSFQLHYRNATPFARMLADIGLWQDLVSMATNRTAELDEITFGNPDIKAMDYFGRWNVRDSSIEPFNPSDGLFSFAQFGGMEGLRAWHDHVGKHTSAIARVMHTKYSPNMYVSDQLLNRCAALESLDRIHSGKRKSELKPCLDRCIELAGDSFKQLVSNMEAWTESIRNQRNDLAHHNDLGSREEKVDQFWLSESLYWLFLLCLLRIAALPQEVSDSVAQNTNFTWCARRLKALGF